MPKRSRATDVIGTILGEAVYGTPQERYADMLGIASVISNRATIAGVSPEDVISAPNQFSAYGNALPPGADQYRGLAEQAWGQVQTIGPVTNATYYSTPDAFSNLPSGLQPVDQTTGHVYAVDPQNRSFRTAKGFVQPTVEAVSSIAGKVAQATEAIARGVGNVVGGLLPDRAPTPASRPAGLPDTPNGLAGLAANADLPSRAQPGLTFSLGPNRPNPPNRSITDIALSAVNDTLGPGHTVDVISGQEDAGGQYGSNRHRTGLAADIQIRDQFGRTLNAVQDRQAMMDVAQAMAAKGALGIGLGTNYMGAKGIHADQVTPGPGQDHEWGNIGNAMAGALADARNFSLMPASFYDKNMPATMPAPPSRPAATATGYRQAADSFAGTGVQNVGGKQAFAAPVDRNIQRSPLGPVSLRPDRQMPSGPVAGSYTPQSLPADRQMPTGPVRPSLPSKAPSAADLAAAYGQMASTMQAAGVKGLGAVPPQTPPQGALQRAAAQTISTPAPAAAPAAPRPSQPVAPAQNFPAAPSAPRNRVKEAIAGAVTGAAVAGLPGAIVGGLLGPQVGRLGKAGGNVLGGLFGAAPNPGRYTYGYGAKAIDAVKGGAGRAGATAHSKSNPAVSYTNLGNGWVAQTNSKFGTTQYSYAGPTGSLFGGGGLFGGRGGGLSDRAKSDVSRSPGGLY